jgi:hypothetical protein
MTKKIPFMLRFSKHSVSFVSSLLVFVVVVMGPIGVVFVASRFIVTVSR